MSRPGKRFFAAHAKSSAMVASLAVHAVLLLLALSFVAVRVIIKDEQSFEARQVDRPRMALKKLQVPVNVKRQQQRPKLRKRIVVAPKLNRAMPDIKMPEVSGLKGGMGSAGDAGLGGAGGVGFSMPEINLFGVRSRGEKVFIILDSTPWIMLDEIGGIPAYAIIKDELVKILGRLGPAVLFNIAVFDGRSYTCFPKMVPATEANIRQVEAWLKPLNAVSSAMGEKDYGTRTLGPGGQLLQQQIVAAPLRTDPLWLRPALLAMEQQADSIFLLLNGWGTLWFVEERNPWPESKLKRWNEKVAEAKKLWEKENRERLAEGRPPRVLGGPASVVRAYFPNEPLPPPPERHLYTPDAIMKAFEAHREARKPKMPVHSGIQNRKRDDFSINVIHFVRQTGPDQHSYDNFKKLTSLAGGKYQTLGGLDAIRGKASSRNE